MPGLRQPRLLLIQSRSDQPVWRGNGFESVQDQVDRGSRRRRRTWRQGPSAQPDCVGPDASRYRSHHWHRHFRAHRHSRSQSGRPGNHDVVSGRGPRVRVRGALLRGIRIDDSDRRLRLHLRVCDARRTGRVDDRLGLDPRVCGRIDDRGDRLERLHAATARGIRRDASAGDRRRATGGHHQPAGRAHRAAASWSCSSSASASRRGSTR